MENACKPRSAAHLRQVILARDVERSPSYKPVPEKGWTFCNKYIRDLLIDLEVPLPGKAALAHEQIDYLASVEGRNAGWIPCESAEAIEFACQGHPVVIGYRNALEPPEGHSHIALVRPNFVLNPDLKVRITQAGRHNYLDAPMALGFGHLPVRFWHHV